jgi:PAS domain S-box-containing protein
MASPNPPSPRQRSSSATIALVYAAVGATWVLVSDRTLEWLLNDQAQLSIANTIKGWAFIALSALLLYWLLQRQATGKSAVAREALKHRSLVLPVTLVALAVAAATAAAIATRFHHHRQDEAIRMQTIAEVKTRQIADWLEERQGDAEFLAGDRRLADVYANWARRGDKASRPEMIGLLHQYRVKKDYSDVLLLEGDGRVIWSSESVQRAVDPKLLTALRESLATGQSLHPSPYRDAGGRVILDFVVPLLPGNGSPAAAVVLRTDPARYLFPLLQSWPVPSASAEILLFRRDGEQVLYLNDLLYQKDAAARFSAPVANPRLLAAQVLRGEIKPGRLFEGEDYRGVPSLGVVRAVLNTDWFVITKIDRAELFSQAWRESLWLGLAGLLTLAMIAIGSVLWLQRRSLDESQRQRARQAEKLRALEVLDNLVHSSDDAIAVKDLQGRYLLFNPAASRTFGCSEEQVLGRDARAFLPADQAEAQMSLDRELCQQDAVRQVEEEFQTGAGQRFLLSTKGPLHDAEGRVVGSFEIGRDITERKHMELELERTAASLRDSLSRAQLLIESALDAVIGMDQAGCVVTWNVSAETMFQYPAEEALGRPLGDLIVPPELRERHAAGLARFIRTGERQVIGKRLELTAMRADGSLFPIELTVGAMQDAGRYLFTAYIRDISERKIVENILRASEQRFRDLVNTTDGIVWEANAQTFNFTFVSEQAERLLGYPVEEWARPGFWVEHMHPDDAAWAPGYCQACTARLEPHKFEYRLIASDGRVVWLHDTVTVVEQDGKPRWLRGIMLDVTERRQSDEMLRKLSLAVEQSPESIVITNVRAQIEYVNEAFSRTTGFSREEVIGRNPRVLHSGRTPRDTYVDMWHALTHGQPWKGEFFNRRKDGSEYVEFAIVTPIRQADGEITHYVAVKEDITEKRRIGRELDEHRHHLEQLVAKRTAQLEEAREKAESANVAKSVFLANMSHEIRTPMNAIVGLTYILRRTQPTPEQEDKLNKINEAAEHLLSIINDILDLSKIEAGKLALEQTDFSLSSILDHTRSLIAESARAKGIGIEVECRDVPTWLRGDPTRLRQALLNFAGNAVKFTSRGTIVLRAFLLKDDDDGVFIRFEVQDTGIGIPADKLPDLFQAFVQADASTTRNFGGTGLGLAISRRLAAMMDGEAGVESEPGKGSTFWFTARLQRGHGIVPIDEAKVSGGTERAESVLRRSHSSARLLLAEDNAVNREVALELIHAAGLNADTARDGREAVAKASNIAYDLILMDVQMPQMNGLDATRAIRALPTQGAVPILAMTANAFSEDRTLCLDAGMNDFIAKPVDPEQFYDQLLKWLPERPAEPEPATRPMPVLNDDERKRHLACIPGLDLSAGLATMRGSIAKYCRLLLLFAEGYQGHGEQIFSLLGAGRIDELEPVVHSLRGASGMLGARRVSDEANAVLLALESDADADRIGRLSATLAEDLGQLIDGIRRHAIELPAELAPTQAPARQDEVLARLLTLLEQGDMSASYLAKEEAQLLVAALGDRALQLTTLINAFDYDAAATLVRGAREKQREPV